MAALTPLRAPTAALRVNNPAAVAPRVHQRAQVKATIPDITKTTAVALGAAAAITLAGPAIAGSQPGIVQDKDHWEQAAKRGAIDMSYKSENGGPLAQSTKDDPVHEFLAGKLANSSIAGFRGHSSDAARKAAEQLDVDEVLRSITPSTIKFRHATPDKA